MKRPNKQDAPTADKILDAATPLFYRRGLGAVTLDEIAAAANVTKRTLYYHFPTKDELVVAYLHRWRSRTKETFAPVNEGRGVVTLLAAFNRLESDVSSAAFRGCPFVNAIAEINDRSHPATSLAVDYKNERQAWFEQLLRTDKIANAKKLSAQIVTLWEGAMVRALVNGNAQCIQDAHGAAAALLKAARAK
jgi:AcrR family transcriptional regulator